MNKKVSRVRGFSILTFLVGLLVLGLIPQTLVANDAPIPVPTKSLTGINNYVVEMSADPVTFETPASFGTSAGEGRMWIDKSVEINEDQFDVTLSVLGQEYIRDKSLTTRGPQAAADVALILDMSTSMDGTKLSNMKTAVNRAIDIIMSANSRNRVGVYYYSNTQNGTMLPLTSYIYEGNLDNVDNRYIRLSGTSLIRNGTTNHMVSSVSLDEVKSEVVEATFPRGSGTDTQRGIFTGVSDLIRVGGSTTLGTNDTERVPYVLLLTDGAANYHRTNWKNYGQIQLDTQNDPKVNQENATTVAYTILTAAKMKKELKDTYAPISNGKDVTWFNVALGLEEGNNLPTAIMKPGSIPSKSTAGSESLFAVYTALDTIVPVSDPMRSTYGIGGDPGYVYASEYIYFIAGDQLKQLDDAIGELADLVEQSTQQRINPIEQEDSSGDQLNLVISDVLGNGMLLKGAPAIGNKVSVLSTLLSTDTKDVYTFADYKAEVTYDKLQRKLEWIIPANEIPLILFESLQKPITNKYVKPLTKPVKLTYSVGLSTTYDGEVKYSSDINTSVTNSYTPTKDNTYYYNITKADGVTSTTAKTLGTDQFPSSITKSANITSTSSYSSTFEWGTAEANESKKFHTKLLNNGKIEKKYVINIASTSNIVTKDGTIEYQMTISNETNTNVNHVKVSPTLPSGLSFVANSIKEGAAAKSSAVFPYTISSIGANQSVVITFKAEVHANPEAQVGTQFIADASITDINNTKLATPAVATAPKVTVVGTFTADVSVKLDNVDYTDRKVELVGSNDVKYTLSKSGNSYSNNKVIEGSYTIYVDDINANSTISTDYPSQTVNYYTVGFYNNDDKYATPAEQIVLSGQQASKPATSTNPSQTGYTFNKWMTAKQDGNEFSFTSTINEKKSIYASWTPNTNTKYKVLHFKSELGGNYPLTATETENLVGTTDALTAAVAKTYTGFTANSITQQKIKPDGSTEVEVRYQRKIYDISYSIASHKGSTTDAVNIKLEYDATPVAPFIVNKDGYSFKNTWSPAIVKVTEDKTYTAQFDLLTYNIEYELDGGSVAAVNPKTYTVESNRFTLTNPTKAGYTFEGWTGNDLTESTLAVTVEKGSIGHRTYEATWSANEYEVNLDDNGGSGGSKKVTVIYDANMPTPESPKLVAPVYSGYEFNGYSDVKNGGVKYYNANLTSAKKWDKTTTPQTLYAIWTELEHITIAYESNNDSYGSVNKTNERVNPQIGTLQGSTATPVAGYKFVKWVDTSGSTVSDELFFKPEQQQGSYKTMTYTAVFEKNSYTIAYDLVEGTTPLANPEHYTIEDESFTLTNPSRLGYYFMGWTGMGVTTPSKTVTVNKGSIGNRAYTAVWQEVSITEEYIVKGKIIDDETPANSIANATVKIMKGKIQHGDTATSDEIGNFTIYNVAEGYYNLSITLGERTAIVEVNITGDNQVVDLKSIIYPYKASSLLTLVGDKTPPIVIDNLHPEAVSYLLDSYNNTGFAKVEMVIKAIDESTNDKELHDVMDNIKLEANMSGKTIGLFLDMTLERYYRLNENVNTKWDYQGLLNRTDGLIKVTIPIPKNLQGYSGYVVYRYHNAVEVINSNKNVDGEYLIFNEENWTITLYAKNYSVYGIAYVSPTESLLNTQRVFFRTEANSEPIYTQFVEFGETANPPKVPQKSGYEFVSWQKENGDTWDFANERVYHSSVLTARWKVVEKLGLALDKENHFAYMQGYPDKSFAPQRNMTRAEVTVMFARLLVEKMDVDKQYPSRFSDVDAKQWYANAIGYMEQFGIITGYSDGTFKPNKSITRAEFATIATRFDKLVVGEPIKFSDVKETYWARDAISFANTKGWIKGYPDGSFKPDNKITRAEVVTLVNRMLERLSDKSFVNNNTSKINQYTDLKSLYWAYYDIMEATNSHDYSKGTNSETWKR